MSIEAMKKALGALYCIDSPLYVREIERVGGAMTALRQAIAEAKKQKPVAFRNTATGEFCTGGFLRKDWAKWQPLYPAPVHAIDISQERVDETPESPPTPPPACQTEAEKTAFAFGWWKAMQRQREWVSLTDEEIKEIIGPWGETPIKGYTRKLFDQIEAKLKEKNHG